MTLDAIESLLIAHIPMHQTLPLPLTRLECSTLSKKMIPLPLELLSQFNRHVRTQSAFEA
jgi:hypothetical protein